MNTRLAAIELEGFRGFSDARRLDLDADAVIIRGDNGAGKTSLVDGILWVFAGELGHLVERVRGMRKVEDAVTNRHRAGDATVTLEIVADGHRWSFTRRGNQLQTALTATCDGAPEADPEQALAEVFGHAAMAETVDAVNTWGLLRQDAVRAALDTAGGALHERLSGILGLERVTRFAAAATTASNALISERTTARKALKRLEERHREAAKRRDDATARVATPESRRAMVRDGIAEINAGLPDGVRLTPADDADLVALEELGRLLAAFGSALESVAAARKRLAALGTAPDDAVAKAEMELDTAGVAAVAATERAPAMTQLAVAALGLLGDRCPVCEQEIDQASVHAHLEEVIEENRRVAAAAQEAAARVARAQTALAAAKEQAHVRNEAEEGVRSALSTAQEAGETATSAGVEVDQAALESAGLADAMSWAVDQLRGLFRRLEQASDVHVTRLADEVTAIGAELANTQQELDELERRCRDAKTLEHAAHSSAEAIVERALERLEPTFAEVFERLNPNPAFTELHARQDVFRNRNQIVPVVRDPDHGVDANPLLVFSEGQLNVVALSYFLGMALNAREGALPFLVLDDPLQALDVLAILGFSDLCRRIRDTRQLIVTTHDRRFADVLVRKLSPRERETRTIVHDFTAWTREGPIVSTREPELAEVIPLVRRQAS
ncbi:MAG: AAA family ATPase [Solirubrobacterales bacterium]